MDDLETRVARLEQLVDDLYARLGAAPAPPDDSPGWQQDSYASGGVSTAVRELVMRGDKLGAIKQYRMETGCDLRTAKNAIDAL